MIVNTSVAIARKGHSVILVDLCPFMSDTGTLLGVQAGHTIGELLQNSNGVLEREELEAVITRHSSGVQLLCGQQSAEEPHELTHNDIEILFQELNGMAEYVLIDLPAFSNELMGDILKKCDVVGLVTGSDAGSLARGISLTEFALSGNILTFRIESTSGGRWSVRRSATGKVYLRPYAGG